MINRVFARGLAVLVIGMLSLASGCGAPKRPDPPPEGVTYQVPWGAVPLENWDPELDRHVAEYVRKKVAAKRKEYGGRRFPFYILALSGGGSRGAYGAGLLTGWTAAGTRPEFDVVTGISTGALMATSAFLGPEDDAFLRLYSETSNEDIFEPRGRLGGFLGDAVYDTTPLRNLIAKILDENLLAAVAHEHEKGRRLYIGTTNLDANVFTIWDMGAIAASGHPDSLQRYRDVVLASASVPGVFPPVYIPVEVGGQRYSQMHGDGSVREAVFYYQFVADPKEALAAVGMRLSDVDTHIYVLHNGQLYADAKYRPVRARTLPIAGAAVAGLMRKNTISSLYRLWVEAVISGANFHLARIPDDVELSDNAINFDPEEMRRLFDVGYQQALNGTAWDTQSAVTDLQEVIDMVNPQVLDVLEARPWLRRYQEGDRGR